MNQLSSFAHQQYLNIKSFRKSGVGVETPVWSVQEGDTLFVRTVANSGKVKRVRNNGNVDIAPCKVNGVLLGEWVSASACEVKDKNTDRKVNLLLGKKYGLMKTTFALASALQGRKFTILEMKVRE